MGAAEPVLVMLATTPSSVEARDWTLLDATERARCLSFATAALRGRYARAHALLRRCLAPMLGLAPGALRFARDDRGRPFLDRSCVPGPHVPDFSLSYGAGMVACALASAGRVGVDLEPVPAGEGWRALVNRALSPEERRWLASRYGAARARRFCQIWALKEAWAKARGEGLGLAFDQVTLRPDSRTGHHADLSGVGDDARAWHFAHRSLDDGNVLAVAWRPEETDAAQRPFFRIDHEGTHSLPD